MNTPINPALEKSAGSSAYTEHELLATYSLLARESRKYPVDSREWFYLIKAMSHFRGMM